MVMNPRSTVIGVFRDQALAEQGLNALRNAGFSGDQIRYSGSGSTGGSGSGSFFGDLKSLFTGETPNGNFTQDMADLDLSDEEARYYENEVRNGHRIIAVKAPGREQEAMSIMRQYGAYSHSMSSSSTSTPNYAQQPSGYASPVGAAAANANQAPRQQDAYYAQRPTNQPQVDADRAARRDQIAQEETIRENRENLQPQTQAGTSRMAQENQVATTAANSDTQLQSMQAQLQSIQQQLRDTRAQLEATRQREMQLQAAKQRDTQMSELQRQLQEAQAQLQAAQQELQAKQARVSQYDQ